MLLAALPATPVQLAHACYTLGYQIVVPASWGDELVAHAVLEDLRHRDRDPVIQCTCPLVTERLLANGQHLVSSMVQTASPPVAAARYARHAFLPRSVRITYVGACPGARSAPIDESYLPDEFLQLLLDRDIIAAEMPTVFDSVLPPDRRRFVSLPGGCPTQEALWQTTEGRMLREVTQPTFAADLAQTLVWREHVIIDVAPSLGCACAGGYSRLGVRCGRVAVMAVEPPRAPHPVVEFQPEFTAPTIEPHPVQSTNGTLAEPGATPANAADTSSAEGKVEPSALNVRHAGTRDRSDLPLPRAYMAKRRYVGPAARQRSRGAAAPSVQPAPATREPATEQQPEPNDTLDIARPIAVHVEAEQGTRHEHPPEVISRAEQFSSDAPFSSATVQERPLGTAVESEPVPAQEDLFELPPHPSEPELEHEPNAEQVATAEEVPVPEAHVIEDAGDAERWGPPAETVPEETALGSTEKWGPSSETTPEEPALGPTEKWGPPSETAPEEPALGPLRVEVEIFEESDFTHDEIIIPVIEPRDETRKSQDRTGEVATRPVRTWGDVVISAWLVLVVSAVIAALLWRR
jgi:hypothetical protein